MARTEVGLVALRQSCRAERHAGMAYDLFYFSRHGPPALRGLVLSQRDKTHHAPSLHELLLAQPEKAVSSPRVILAQPQTVRALLINVQVERHARALQRSREFK